MKQRDQTGRLTFQNKQVENLEPDTAYVAKIKVSFRGVWTSRIPCHSIYDRKGCVCKASIRHHALFALYAKKVSSNFHSGEDITNIL